MNDKSETYDVVIIEDSLPNGTLYRNYLESAGYSVKLFNTGKEGFDFILESPPKVLLQDVHLPDMNGIDIVRKVQEKELPVLSIVVTAQGSVDVAVDAMRSGGFDFIEKPFPRERLLVTVENALKQLELLNTVQTYKDEIDRETYYDFTGKSLSMQVVYRIIESAAISKASIFITGESGTGKEICAEAIHKASKRSEKPLIALNCAAIPRELFESEIFGHVRGAFSGATSDRAGAAQMAHGGTLFLDEICEMDMDLQAKLLRFIQTGTFRKVGGTKTEIVDVRFVCATNKDPNIEVSEGRFREDLLYRLNVIPMHLPPLREREEDVLHIGRKVLKRFTEDLGKSFRDFSPDVISLFLKYDWPGNVRELQNVIENTVIMHEGKFVELDMLPDFFRTNSLATNDDKLHSLEWATKNDDTTSTDPDVRNIEPLWLTEKRAIEAAIEYCNNNIPVAAAHLGLSASTIYRKIKSWQNSGN